MSFLADIAELLQRRQMDERQRLRPGQSSGGALQRRQPVERQRRQTRAAVQLELRSAFSPSSDGATSGASSSSVELCGTVSPATNGRQPMQARESAFAQGEPAVGALVTAQAEILQLRAGRARPRCPRSRAGGAAGSGAPNSWGVIWDLAFPAPAQQLGVPLRQRALPRARRYSRNVEQRHRGLLEQAAVHLD